VARRDTRTVGGNAESFAHRFLKKQGLDPVEKNFRCRLGEIDLIMLDRDCLVFVEVRYRATNRFVPAKLSVDSRKQRKLMKTALIFLSKNERFARHTVRFDVVALDGDSIEWICDAFRPADSSL